MYYKIRSIKLDDNAEVCWRARRCETFVTHQELRLGGMYFLRPDKLYIVEGILA